MNKTYAILGLIILIAVGGFIIFGKDKYDAGTNNNTSGDMNYGNSSTNDESSVDDTVGVDVGVNAYTDMDNYVPSTIAVSYTSSGFSPSTISINVGDTVKFTNNTSGLMRVSSNPHPMHGDFPDFNASRDYAAGTSYSYTFEESGSFGFHDHIRPGMGGTIVVAAGDK